MNNNTDKSRHNVPSPIKISFILHIYHGIIAVLGIIACILYVVSTSIATNEKAMVPFHLDSETNLMIERALLPVFVCLVYLITAIPIPQTTGRFQTACDYIWRFQNWFKTGRVIRPLILVYLFLHLGLKSFIVLQEIRIYGVAGKLTSLIASILPKAVCTSDNSLCGLYKGAAWSALILSLMVFADIIIVDKNREALKKHAEEQSRRRFGGEHHEMV